MVSPSSPAHETTDHLTSPRARAVGILGLLMSLKTMFFAILKIKLAVLVTNGWFALMCASICEFVAH